VLGGARRMGSRRRLAAATLALAASALVPIGSAGSAVAQEGGPPVLAGLTVTGNGVETYPNFGPTTRRFGIRTTAETGPITVTATTASAGDVLTIGGLPATSGQGRSFTGLHPGEELTVRVANAAGQRIYGLVYLPADFPTIPVTTRQPGIAPGRLFLGFFIGPPYNVVMDNNGVPLYVSRRPVPTFDFKPQPTGQYTFLEDSGEDTVTGRTVFDAVVLNPAMRIVARHQTVPPLTNTDNHDVMLLPDGNRILLAYDPNVHDGVLREDSVIQEVDAAGNELMRWSSWGDIPLADNLSGNLVEYAHINSVAIDHTDGNLIASLRGTSEVIKVNRQTGELMWRLGGRSSDFTIDDPLGSFCGQHTASRLANGNLLVFDNGVDCPPNGADRGVSRAAEYAIDEVTMTAELVWSHSQGLFGFATGSTQRFVNGNTLIAWGTNGTLTEVDANGDILWEAAPRTVGGTTAATYRVHRAPFPDEIPPRVAFANPPDGATFLQGEEVRARYACVDEGGASVTGCDGSVPSGGLLDTSTAGEHSVTVTATDGAGNVRHSTRTYTVVPFQPDLAVRRGADGRLVGNDVYSATGEGQTRVTRVPGGGLARFTVVAENDGVDRDTFLLRGTRHNGQFAVRYFEGLDDVSAAVKAGTYRLRRLQPGDQHTLRVRVTARPGVPAGARLDVFLVATSLNAGTSIDVVKMVTRRV
jgi:Arylsulfotransferase (ASST)